MKLGGKNLCYSLILASVMLLFLVGYFIYMLPSLYVEYAKEENLNAIKKQHRAYVEDGNYDKVQVKNPIACFSIFIPDEGDSIFVTGKSFSIEVVAADETLAKMLEECKALFRAVESEENTADYGEIREKIEQNMENCGKTIVEILKEKASQEFPLEIRILETMDMDAVYHDSTVKYHIATSDMIVVEMGISDDENRYTNYLAMERTGEGMVFSFLPLMAPDMSEIRPVVLQSIPMLVLVVLLLVLLFSQLYSSGIVAPIEKLVSHTQTMRQAKDFSVLPVADSLRGRKDELSELAGVLDELYAKVRDNYRELEKKNEELQEENERKEIFLRTSSHQLKTPISASLLLLDGMISGVGKYQNTAEYLPEVKKQLLSMRKMVEDILYLNHCEDQRQLIALDLREVIENLLLSHQVEIAQKQLKLHIEGKKQIINSDEVMLTQIMDNLLSNALRYTPQNGLIEIFIEEKSFCIVNHESHIPEELLPHIFEPFVNGNQGTESHGLGLYIAAYFAKRTNAAIQIQNEADAVRTQCIWA